MTRHFTAIAKREGFTIGAPVEYDYSQYQHQVPGGMLSNLRFNCARSDWSTSFRRRSKKRRVREECG